MREHIEMRINRILTSSKSFLWSHTPNETLIGPNSYQAFETSLFESVTTLSSADFALNYQVLSFLKKWKGWPNTSRQALDKSLLTWQDCEKACFATNYRLKSLDNPILQPDVPYCDLITRSRVRVMKLIGPKPPTYWKQLCDWPTGATFDTKMDSTVGEKVCKTVTCSKRAYPYAAEIIGEFDFEPRNENRVEFVPKTFKVHRPIACEPTVNAFLQKGCGRALRAELKRRCGIDIRSQAQINRDLCFLSQSCQLSTVDLESASDTLSYQLIKLLLPEEWFSLLDDLRCEYSNYKGKRTLLEKFSSMGNGFTFELETVIFRAICEACLDILCLDYDTLAVYGDDIVIPRAAYALVTKALVFFGLKINESKSFMDGLFYESCGKHYHDENDVTPAYQKEVVGNNAFQLIAMHNRLFRWGTRTGNQSVSRQCCAIILKEAENLRFFRKHGLPFQPIELEGDFGFITSSQKLWGKYDRHGDYILNRALCKIQPVISLINHHDFYKDNWLRCNNSFYGSRQGYMEYVIGQRSFIKSKKKLWRGGEYDLTNHSHKD